MLIGLYGSHHINIPTKHFNFQLSIFNSSSIQAKVHFQFSTFNFQFFCLRSAFALPSLYLRSRFAPTNYTAATPKRLFNGIGTSTLRYSYSCYSSIFPKSVIRIGHAMRNSYSVTVPFPNCITHPRSVFSNCNNCSVTPTNIILPCRRIVVFLQYVIGCCIPEYDLWIILLKYRRHK